MKLFILSAIAVLYSMSAFAQSKAVERNLYGVVTKDSLLTEPYKTWYQKNYYDYTTNKQVSKQLHTVNLNSIVVEIFFGSWCGDSKRELPRIMKILDELKLKPANIKLIAVGSSDSLYKQSPTGEHTGKGIYRVPTIIVYENGKELNRIIETPAYSMERDLLAILKGEEYTPNYKSFAYIQKWINNGSMIDSNINIRGLANQIKPKLNNENELNSLAYLLIKQKLIQEALQIFRINAVIYPESANIASSLGEGYLENGMPEKAIPILENSLALTKDATLVKEILRLLYKAKGVK
jgi:thiol-disulfide isomerase/thioredoxin